MSKEARLLVVDDEKDMCETLAYFFRGKGYRTEIATTGCQASERLRSDVYDLVIADIRLPDKSGIELLDFAGETAHDTAFIFMTAFASLETAVRALNKGAFCYLTKPFDLRELAAAVEKALENQRLVQENRRLLAELRRKNEELEKLSITDGLTGLHNRRHLEEILATEEARSQRYGHPVTVVMVDINNLKYINDHFGHAEGDMTITETAMLLRNTCRASDVVARYGGDEFVVLSSETAEEGASCLVDRIREAERQWHLSNTDSNLTLDLAIGYASTENGATLLEALRRADANMYEDKDRHCLRSRGCSWARSNSGDRGKRPAMDAHFQGASSLRHT